MEGDAGPQTQVSTLAVLDNLLIAGGFQGEIICKYLDRPGVTFCTRTTYDDNAITNAIEIYDNPSGAVHFMATNNDCGVRVFDMERFQLIKFLQKNRGEWENQNMHCSNYGANKSNLEQTKFEDEYRKM
ncbi:uncharacterized WD repeat-containing [Olea europaea subsp. europaea]|uniref:Uncharacterized WD repeat-containing n=1 Tax=Olea europaea subsp. europaea TaxID=158383 RepID=A0A8S0PCQ1_OLEEU|nr:uncharacterized WD repeat-containing [Olea europaea subsp. europaea]